MPIQFSMKELHTLHAFHPDTLAYRANVYEVIIIAMLNNEPVPQIEAKKVLAALSPDRALLHPVQCPGKVVGRAR